MAELWFWRGWCVLFFWRLVNIFMLYILYLISQQQTIYLPSLPLVIFGMKQLDLCIGFWPLWLTCRWSIICFVLLYVLQRGDSYISRIRDGLPRVFYELLVLCFFLKKLLKKDDVYTQWLFFMIISQPCKSQFLIFLTKIIDSHGHKFVIKHSYEINSIFQLVVAQCIFFW